MKYVIILNSTLKINEESKTVSNTHGSVAGIRPA